MFILYTVVYIYIYIYIYIYVRATCFDLVDHPQALQENRSKSCLSFSALWDLNAYMFQLQELKSI